MIYSFAVGVTILVILPTVDRALSLVGIRSDLTRWAYMKTPHRPIGL